MKKQFLSGILAQKLEQCYVQYELGANKYSFCIQESGETVLGMDEIDANTFFASIEKDTDWYCAAVELLEAKGIEDYEAEFE